MKFQIIQDIISKKELNNLDWFFVKEFLESYLKKNKKTREKIAKAKSFKELKKSSEYKQMIKDIRTTLREIYGVFILSKYKSTVKKFTNGKADWKDILKEHKSSKERFNYYEKVYEKIFEITGKPRKILDLGCGMNPFSYFYLGCRPDYYASDISSEDMKIVQSFFDRNNIKGSTFQFNMSEFKKTKFLKNLEELNIDICFLFKLLDSLESLNRNISAKIIKNLPCKWLVVSFPKQSLGGKKEIALKRRSWFINILKSQKLSHKSLEIPNEFFFIIKKS